jgi:polyferredoxin
MNARTLDVLTGIASLAVFILALMAFPLLVPGQEGMAYVLAIAVYIALMSGAGVLIREKIA